jgi:hypothetical protein
MSVWFRFWRPDYFWIGSSKILWASDNSPFNRGQSLGFGFFAVDLRWNEGRSVSREGIHYGGEVHHHGIPGVR